jgi:uncharacterized protein (DUF934 family)
MTVLINDTGFTPDDWTHGFTDDPEQAHGAALDLASDADAATLQGHLDGPKMIRIAFPSFADGRGFTIARQLRLMGYTGRLRAAGHVLADQYAMARRVGFDEVEISDAHAERQPEASWTFRADWKDHDYQSRLRG